MRAETLRLWVARPAGALLMGLGLSIIPTSCAPQPAQLKAATVSLPESWEIEVAAIRAAYEGMDDLERMAGVVLEPTDEEEADK